MKRFASSAYTYFSATALVNCYPNMMPKDSSKSVHEAEAALTLQNVTVRYGPVTALEDFTLAVKRGEQVAVVGPNGAGKSTLFGVITGLVKPTAGRVDVYGSEPGEHHCIGYVPQRSEIDRRFPASVFDVVMMGRVGRIGLFRRAGRQDRRLVMEALEAVDMAHLAKRQIGELSGGQQQRVLVARALAQETHLLLLDEPLAGLDTPSQENTLGILAKLKQQGITMLVAIHDLNQAAAHFQRTLLINRRLIAHGASDKVLSYANLASAYGNLLQSAPLGNGHGTRAQEVNHRAQISPPPLEYVDNPYVDDPDVDDPYADAPYASAPNVLVRR